MDSTRSIADWQSPFLPQHEEYLTKRAVPLQLAEAAGLKSVTPTEGALLLGLEYALRSGGLAIPYFERDELLGWRVRLDAPGTDEKGKEKNKFLAAPGQVWPYIPPPAILQGRVWESVDESIHVVEGPVKALALCADGLPAIGLGGVTAGGHDAKLYKKTGEPRVHPLLQRRVALQGRDVVLVFDAGRVSNPNVADGEALNAAALRNAGAHVRVSALPLREDGGDQGPDDFLANQGHDRLTAIIDAAVPADPIERVRALAQSDPKASTYLADELLTDLPFLAALRRGGDPVVNRVAEELKKFGIPKTQTKRAVDGLVRKLRVRAEAMPGDVKDKYARIDGRICYHQVDRNGIEFDVALANFDASISEEICIDDGAEVTHTFVVEGSLADGTALPDVTVKAAEFEAMKWIPEHWGARAIVEAGHGIRDKLRAGIQTLSAPSQHTLYSHTGWRSINGEDVYLYHGGAVGCAGVSVELDGSLAACGVNQNVSKIDHFGDW